MSEAWKQCEGQVVEGKFRLRQYVGGSDHSAVFLTELNGNAIQKAAIKFIPAIAANSATQIAQWQVASKLTHPHLLQIFDAGRCQLGGRDLFFIVTEYAEENLAQILPHRALASTEGQDMLPPILDVLSYIHNQGLVHSHLKPANVMAVHDQLKISSDGIMANGLPERKLQEASPYNAPEIASGIVPASDVWSLGMTLVEVLTQRPLLWDGRGEPVVPETVPSPFRNIASHCLRQDPQRRWTLKEIAAGLQSPAKQGTAELSRRPSSSSSKPLKKSRVIGPIIAILILLAVVAGGRKLLRHQASTDQSPSAAAPSPVPASSGSAEPTPVPEPAKPVETHAIQRASKTSKSSTSGGPHGSVVQQILPAISPSARHTVQGRIRIRIRVDVDPSGNVVNAKFESAGPSKYFSNKTIEAARQWKFAAPQMDGQAAASVWVLKFAIGRTGTTVQSSQTKP